MSIRNHELWPELRKYLVVQIYSRDGIKRPRFRLNFRPMPPELFIEAQKIEVPCLACGEMIHPIRKGTAFASLYFAGSCPLERKIACSRSRKVSAEYEAIKKDFENCVPDENQIELF